MVSTAPEKKPLRRRRCLNCGELFEPVKGTNGPRQKFCLTNGRQCRDEYNKAGGVSFVRYRRIVESAVAKAKREILYEVREMLRKCGVSKEIRERFTLSGAPLEVPPEMRPQ